jgi:hypothetical protein
MKNILLGVILGIILSGLLAFTVTKSESNSLKEQDAMLQPEKDLSLGHVQKMSGKLVFLNCEPVNNYDIAFEIKVISLGSFKSPDDIANSVVKNALKTSKKDNMEFDAVIVGSGRIDVAIKFK